MNVLTNPVNLATQVTGVLAGANMAATNLAGGNNPGGVAGTLPGSSVAVFVASGASHAPGAVPDPGASAGTTHFLREDATWQTIPASGVSEATWTAFTQNYLGNAAGYASAQTLLPQAHTLKRFTISMSTGGTTGCSTFPVWAIRDITAASNLATITFTSGTTFLDSGVLSVSMTAGHTIGFYIQTAGVGCTFPSESTATIVFI